LYLLFSKAFYFWCPDTVSKILLIGNLAKFLCVFEISTVNYSTRLFFLWDPIYMFHFAFIRKLYHIKCCNYFRWKSIWNVLNSSTHDCPLYKMKRKKKFWGLMRLLKNYVSKQKKFILKQFCLSLNYALHENDEYERRDTHMIAEDLIL
jgi:hypothetical protein